jgi:acetyl-CoA carboxylase biotin carboxyl carrier protein
MNEKDIRKYAALMKELELSGLEVTDGEKMVRLERNVAQEVIRPTVEVSAPAEAAAPAVSDNIYTVKSPFVGLFYAAPTENSEPYVSLGDRVRKGQTLCIVAAMKLMNEISAEEDGEIAEICVTNGQMVEYGTELFRIRR